MTLTKGNLRNTKDAVSKQWISTGVLSELCVALATYGLTIQIKEAFRLLTLSFHSDILIHTAGEDTFYNTFYALISSVIGCSLPRMDTKFNLCGMVYKNTII